MIKKYLREREKNISNILLASLVIFLFLNLLLSDGGDFSFMLNPQIKNFFEYINSCLNWNNGCGYVEHRFPDMARSIVMRVLILLPFAVSLAVIIIENSKAKNADS